MVLNDANSLVAAIATRKNESDEECTMDLAYVQ